MATTQTVLGRVPTYAGPWDSNYVNPKTGHNGYPEKKRVTLYGSEFQSKLEDNTYAPATLNAAGTQITFDTTHWDIISNGTDAYLLSNQTAATLTQIETEQEAQRGLMETMVSNVAYDTSNKKITKTINNSTTDVVTVATLKTDLNLTKSDVGLSNVTNEAQIPATEKGANGGVATLDNTGKVPSSQLDLSAKADKDTDAVEDNVAVFDTNSNPVDSGTAIDDIALKDGYYPDLHSGLTDNLFGSTQTNDVFTFRPTAGIQDVESGDAPVGGGTIKKVEGNAVAWNQFSQLLSYDKYGVVLTPDASGVKATISGIPSSGGNLFLNIGGSSITAGHKIYLSYKVNGVADGSGDALYDISNVIPAGGYNGSRTLIYEATNAPSYLIIRSQVSQDYTFSFNTIDLTLMFGAGNEPSTVAEFEQWLANNVGLKDYYPYNEGELIPVKDFKVKSVGFNQWDEQYSANTKLNPQTGVPYSFDGVFVSKNFIPILPNTQYYYKNDRIGLRGCFYDSNYNFIEFMEVIGLFTTPPNSAYMKFYSSSTDGTYNYPICINLSDTDRNGDYEEHWEREVGIDVTKVYGKLNGTGESVQVFPDGLKSAGTVRDEIVRSGDVVKAIKRIVKVTVPNTNWLGAYTSTTEWGGVDTIGFYVYNSTVGLPTKVDSAQGISDYLPYSSSDCYYNENVGWNINSSYFAIRIPRSWLIPYGYDNSSDESNIAAIKSWYADHPITVQYPVEPQEYILDEDILPVQYRVDNYGTEEVLLGNDEGLVSSSPKMTISYGINAADTIADLPHSYVSVLPQQLDEEKQKQARQNINAASQDSIIRIQEQLDAINPKVDNDVYVDMGLPSGLLWAKRNIDVTQPDGFAASEYSYDASFFSWGNVDGHNPTGTTFDYSFDSTTYASTPGSKLTGNISLSYDAARAALGAPWRMPSKEDILELFDNCDFIDANGDLIASTQANKLVTMNNVTGIRLKSKNNGNILFFPCCGIGSNGTALINKGAGGYYYTGSRYNDSYRRSLVFISAVININSTTPAENGLTIRPVM